MDFRPHLSGDVLSLVDSFIPHNPKEIKKNSSQAFLVKVVASVKSKLSSAASLALPVKLEVAAKARTALVKAS